MYSTSRLKTIKLPFADWVEMAAETGLSQYTKENCDRAQSIVENLRGELMKLGEAASEAEILAAIEAAVTALNSLNNLIGGQFIETGEREELCDLFDEFAEAAGLVPSDYCDGEGPATLWREW
ncbi:MAG: hypothetical protein AB8G16_19720 [Gammaproteobacteria bacterium]